MSLKAKLPIWVFITVAGIGVATILLITQYSVSTLNEIRLRSIENAYYSKNILKTNQLADWKTYQNEIYGYELRYPEGWVIDNTYSDSLFTLRGDPGIYMGGDTYWSNYVWSPEEPMEAPADYRDLYLIIYKDNPDYTIEDFVNESYYKYGQTDIVQRSDFKTLGAVEGRQYSTVNSDHPVGVKGLFTVFKLDDKFFVFKSSWQSKDIHNQILSTFKFIEPIIDTSDWKTYRNEKYGFEFNYQQGLEFNENQNKSYVWFGEKPLTNDGPVIISVEVKENTINGILEEVKNTKNYSNVKASPLKAGANNFTLITWNQPSLPGAEDTIRNGHALISKNNFVYEFCCYNNPGFDQILSTFKFID